MNKEQKIAKIAVAEILRLTGRRINLYISLYASTGHGADVLRDRAGNVITYPAATVLGGHYSEKKAERIVRSCFPAVQKRIRKFLVASNSCQKEQPAEMIMLCR
jgi:hypothetical protein